MFDIIKRDLVTDTERKKVICLVSPIIGLPVVAECRADGSAIKLCKIVTIRRQQDMRTGQFQEAMEAEILSFSFPEFIETNGIRRLIPFTDENLASSAGSHLRKIHENYENVCKQVLVQLSGLHAL